MSPFLKKSSVFVDSIRLETAGENLRRTFHGLGRCTLIKQILAPGIDVAEVCDPRVVMHSRRDIDIIFPVRELGRRHKGSRLVPERAAENDRIVGKQICRRGVCGKNALDGRVAVICKNGVYVLSRRCEVGVRIFKCLKCCRSEYKRFIEAARLRSFTDTDYIVEREGNITEKHRLCLETDVLIVLVHRCKEIHVAVRVLVAPDIEGTVLHEYGGRLISAGQLFYLFDINAFLVKLLRHRKNKA